MSVNWPEADQRTLAGRDHDDGVTFDAADTETNEWGRRGATRAIGLRPKNGHRRCLAAQSPVEFGAESPVLRRV